jgi:hypothetical protein
MAESILKKHQLDITVGVELNDAQRKATSAQIKNMANQWQDILDDAIKKGIEDGARSASLNDVLTQFNAQLKAFKLEPLTITVDELQIMDKPIEHAAKLVIQKLGNSFKGGGLGNIISSEITDSLDTIGGAVDKIYQKMEQGAKKSADNIEKYMLRVQTAASKISKEQMKSADRALNRGISIPKTQKDAHEKFQNTYVASKNQTDKTSVDAQIADVAFVRSYETLEKRNKLSEVFGDQLSEITEYYNKLAKIHQAKMNYLNDILVQNEYVGGTGSKPIQYNQFKGGEPWAREKTLQEIKSILSGELTVKDGPSGGNSGFGGKEGKSGNNLDTSKLEGDLNKAIESRINAEKRAEEAARKIAEAQNKLQKSGYTIYRGINNEEPQISRGDALERYIGEYWTQDKSTAAFYAQDDYGDGQLLQTTASPKNPLVLDAERHEYDDIEGMTALISTLKELGMNIDALLHDSNVTSDDIQREINEFALSKEYDSVITNNIRDAGVADGPITSTIAILDDSILSTITAFDVLNGEIQKTPTEMAKWYHGPDDEDLSHSDGDNKQLESQIAQLRDEEARALKDIDAYSKKESNIRKRMQQIDKAAQQAEQSVEDLNADLQVTKDKPSNINQQHIDNTGDTQSSPTVLPTSESDTVALTNLNTILSNLITVLNAEKTNVTAAIDATELSGVLHDGKPYVVEIKGKGADNEENKVAIDTEGLKSVLTGIVFKVQDTSEKEPINSAIDQESINNLVGAIKTSITPQSDGAPKDSGPWAKEETLRNITGSTLGKIANSMPKVDTKNLAKNDILNRVAQATEAINNKISGKISGNINDIKNEKKREDAKKRDVEQKALLEEFRKLGQKDAQKSLAAGDGRDALDREIRGQQMRLGKKRKALGVDASDTKHARTEGRDEALNAHNEMVAEQEAKITKDLTQSYNNYMKLMDKRENIALKMVGLDPEKNKQELNALQQLYNEVDNLINNEYGDILGNPDVQKRFTIDQFDSRYQEWQRKGAVKLGKAEDAARNRQINEEIKAARKSNNLDLANSAYNTGRKTLASAWQFDPSVDYQSIPQFQALQTELQKLDVIYKQVNDKIRAGQALSDEEIINLQMSTGATAEKTEKLKELIKNYNYLKNGQEIGTYVADAESDERQLRNAINNQFQGRARIKEYRQGADGSVTTIAEVKTGARAFTEYAVAISQADNKIKMLKGTTKQLPSFLDGVKRKLGEISQYFSAMSVISRLGQELRKGVQYVRDIDLALTELKKVTDETEETYDKFLDTASKTAAKVGSTIKDVISSTADWARLGYSMEQAAKFAESTQILMNVSEFTDVSRATDTLISSVQAFGYTAETSMEVVDLLNTIGNNYAISTADLASSLTKSSASLVAAGGDLAEAAALTATANAIIQD